MKLNNKGFALTSIIYMLIVLFLMLLLLILANLAQRKVVLDKIKYDVKEKLNQGGQSAQNTYTVTFNPTIGQVNQTTKQVTYGTYYGELPTPSKEDYKFMGWKNKNIFNMNEWIESISGVTRGTIETSNNSIAITSTGNDSFTQTYGESDKYYRIKVKPNTTYTLSWKSDNTQKMGIVYVFCNGKLDSGYMFSADDRGQKKQTFKTTSDTTFINIRLGVTPSNTTITYYDMQLEEGSDATTYEPYQEYTSDTIVTKKENHTLYATWERLYTITFDPQEGQINQTTKQVMYDQPYGELPVPTKEGYTLITWRGKNIFNMNEWIASISGVTRGTIETSNNSIALTSTGNDSFTQTYGESDKYYRIKVKPNTTYTLSWKSDNTDKMGIVYIFCNGKLDSGYMFNADDRGQKQKTFKTPADATFINIRLGVTPSNTTITYYDMQLEEGSNATTYEPYQEYTSDTIVTKQENHTLYAIWQANE